MITLIHKPKQSNAAPKPEPEPAPIIRSKRILFIDAYDSFSNNIVSLLRSSIPDAEVEVVKIDDRRFFLSPASKPTLRAVPGSQARPPATACLTPPADVAESLNQSRPQKSANAGINLSAFYAFISEFDAVVAGPGPGHPSVPADVGVIPALWEQNLETTVPVLGICLGFQSLAQHAGLKVCKLSEARHGLTVPIVHQDKLDALFAGIDPGGCVVTVYHSLGVRFRAEDAENREAAGQLAENETMFWNPGRSFVPLAWDCTSTVNGPVLMAMRDTDRPFWGVQYHPESICTNESGQAVIRNWWEMTLGYRTLHPTKKQKKKVEDTTRRTPLHMDLNTGCSVRYNKEADTDSAIINNVSIPDIVELLKHEGSDQGEQVVLQSCHRKDGTEINRDGRDRYTIIGIVEEEAVRIFYNVSTKVLEVKEGLSTRYKGDCDNVWSYLTAFMHQFEKTPINGLDPEIPFWGGLVGYISYEAGLETLKIAPAERDERVSDVSFVFISRSIVVDHYTSKVTAQSFLPEDHIYRSDGSRCNDSWAEQTIDRVRKLSVGEPLTSNPDKNDTFGETFPNADEYGAQIRECQEQIRAGESYELCLTGKASASRSVYPSLEPGYPPQYKQSFIESARVKDSWKLYLNTCVKNPAPYSAYMRLRRWDMVGEHSIDASGFTIVSSSPEKFLSWTRDGECQMRPIKGTLGKTDWTRLAEVVGEEELVGADRSEKIPLSLAQRYFELNIKERAENLMIVDLIRHDLHGVCEGKVKVPGCMVVEEYGPVYQLVSVIEANLELPKKRRRYRKHDPDGFYLDREHLLLFVPKEYMKNGYWSRYDTKNPGIGVLASSLPPGSMTGAPKLRSCQLLNKIEGKNRGIYSGVLGWLDVGGSGHFSVLIRTGFRWDWEGEVVHDDGQKLEFVDKWHVGAGGAITAKSEVKDEIDEMMLKAKSTLNAWKGSVVYASDGEDDDDDDDSDDGEEE